MDYYTADCAFTGLLLIADSSLDNLTPIIDLSGIQHGHCRGVCIREPEDAFVLKIDDDTAYCYLNSCPHTLSPLNWMPDAFLSDDRRHIICANHGALFSLHDGLCVFGPCVGQKLSLLPTEIRGQHLYLSAPLNRQEK